MPALVVEVFSPSARRFDLVRRQHDYAAAGVRELWFVDPDERCLMPARNPSCSGAFTELVEVGPGDELRSPLLEGFSLAVDAVFAR